MTGFLSVSARCDSTPFGGVASAPLMPACLARLQRQEPRPGGPEVPGPVARRDPVAVRRTAVPAVAAPAPAAEHAVRGPLLIEVLAPPAHVTVHVIQAEPVRRVRADGAGALQVGAFGRLAGRMIAVEI